MYCSSYIRNENNIIIVTSLKTSNFEVKEENSDSSFWGFITVSSISCWVVTSISQILSTQAWGVKLGHRKHDSSAQFLFKITHPNRKSERLMLVSQSILLCPHTQGKMLTGFRGKSSFNSDFYFLNMTHALLTTFFKVGILKCHQTCRV